MRLSIQSKFTLSLLATSLCAVLVVGLIARSLLLRDFNQLTQEDAFSRFRISISRYVKTYGSLEKALKQESFSDFQRRSEPALTRRSALPGQWSAWRGPGTLEPDVPAGLTPGPPAEGFPGFQSGSESSAPRGAFEDPEGAPGAWGNPGPGPEDWTPDGSGPPARFRPDPPEGRAEALEPPFRFMFLDPGGRLRGGEAKVPIGSLMSASVRKSAQPVIVGGKVVALAVPDANPNLTRKDRAYLDAMGQSLWSALGVTFLIAIVFGAAVGRRLGRDLGILTRAVEAVGEGSLGQEVRIRSQDEVGVLAGAFNRMSTELVRAHEELEQSAAQIREQAARMQELSIRDGLTGLFNRRHFDERVAAAYAQASRYQQPLTLVVGDIDYFKRINDRFSHAVGDEVLRRVAFLLRSSIRESDLVARYGGEEFVLAFTNTAALQAALACEKLRLAIETHPWHEIHPDLRVTMSLGLSDWLSLGGPEQMIGAADAQLYRSKEDGRNRVSWEKAAQALTETALPYGTLGQG